MIMRLLNQVFKTAPLPPISVIHVLPQTEIDEVQPIVDLLTLEGYSTQVVDCPIGELTYTAQTEIVVDLVSPSPASQLGRDSEIVLVRDKSGLERFLKAAISQRS